MEDYEVSNASEWSLVSNKKAKHPNHSVLQSQVASLRIGPSHQKPSQLQSHSENQKAKARTTYPIASPKLQKHSYSEVARNTGAAQDTISKRPLQKVTSKQGSTQIQKPVLPANIPRWPSQPSSIKGKGHSKSADLKQIPIRPANSKAENSARRPIQPSHFSTGPHEDNSSKRKTEPRAIGCTQRHDISGPDSLKFNVTYTETKSGLNYEQNKHTTVSKAQLPFHRRSSSVISPERRRQSITHQDRQQLLESEEDNPAKNDYRQRKNPTLTIPLPKFSVISCSGKKSRNSSTAQRLKQIELYTGTCIIPSTAEKSLTSVLKVWGTAEQAASAADLIQSWISEPKPASGKKWAHIPSLNETQKEKLRKRIKREEKQNEFRKAPPEGVNFGWIGVFGWPVHGYRPDKVLGRNCEALDPIRMEYYVYISWNAAEKHFKIYGQRQDQVEAVMESLNHTFCQVIARGFAISEMSRSFVKPPRTSCNQNQVMLNPAYPIKSEHYPPRNDDPRRSIRLSGPPMQGSDTIKRNAGSYIKNCRNEDRIIHMIFQALERLRWYRGNLQMRARLGSLIISRYMKTSNGQYSLDKFEDMMSSDAVKAYVGKGIRNIDEAALLSKLQRVNHVLFPINSLVREGGQMKAVISGTFILCGDRGTSNLRLYVEFHEAADKFELFTAKWSKLESDKIEPAEVINLNHVDSESGLAWQFAITASGPLGMSRIPENYQAFARSIKVRTSYSSSLGPTERLLIFDSPAAYGVPLITFEEAVTWRFNMVLSEYICELMRTQKIFMARQNTTSTASAATMPEDFPVLAYPNIFKGRYRVCGLQAILHEPEWCLQVWHNNWDTVFDQNVALPVGKRAKWEPDPSIFLPSDFQPLVESSATSTTEGDAKRSSRIGFAPTYSSDDGAQTSSESESEQRRRLRTELKSKPVRKPKEPRDPKNPFPGSREGFKVLNRRLRMLQALVLDEEFFEEEYEMPPLGNVPVYTGLDDEDGDDFYDDGFDDGFDDLIYE